MPYHNVSSEIELMGWKTWETHVHLLYNLSSNTNLYGFKKIASWLFWCTEFKRIYTWMKIDNNYSVWSSQVFTILALCAHEPLPLSTFERFLKAQPNDDPRWRIQAIKDCDLLTFLPEQEKPTDSYDEVERVYFYEHTHKAFNDKFIRRGEWPYVFLVSCLKHRNGLWVIRKIRCMYFQCMPHTHLN